MVGFKSMCQDPMVKCWFQLDTRAATADTDSRTATRQRQERCFAIILIEIHWRPCFCFYLSKYSLSGNLPSLFYKQQSAFSVNEYGRVPDWSDSLFIMELSLIEEQFDHEQAQTDMKGEQKYQARVIQLIRNSLPPLLGVQTHTYGMFWWAF